MYYFQTDTADIEMFQPTTSYISLVDTIAAAALKCTGTRKYDITIITIIITRARSSTK